MLKKALLLLSAALLAAPVAAPAAEQTPRSGGLLKFAVSAEFGDSLRDWLDPKIKL